MPRNLHGHGNYLVDTGRYQHLPSNTPSKYKVALGFHQYHTSSDQESSNQANHYMQTFRITNRTAPRQIYRIIKPTTTPARTMALFPRVFQNDFAPMFRLMDDYANHVATLDPFNATGESLASRFKTSFSPRFDFKENKDAYELHGELPGVEQKDVEIEFTDANTLSIRGRTERVREEGTRPAAIESAGTRKQIGERKNSDDSGSYHKPTVEDEGAVASAQGREVERGEAEQAESEGSKYWVSERSIGTFARTFSFPQRVDQDAVKASLKNGILSIVVPKAAPVSRRITVE